MTRSLCDQDERLQDEINSLAYGKGKRRSSRIDIVSGSFIEEQDTILLEGFEEKLRNSLFDQIVDKTSNNWDLWFFKLKEFLERNPEYPSQKTDRELYQWVAQQRNRKKNGNLKNEEIRKLNSINFAWSIVEWKWNRQFEIFEEYARSNEFPPCKGIDDDDLVKWYKYQQTCIRYGKIISDYQKSKFLSIDRTFSGPASRKKWIPTYNALVDFRKENPDRWPAYDRKNSKSEESQLSVFCQEIRKRFRENSLSNYWFEKMAELEFNFEGKTDNWTSYFKEVKGLISDKDSISADQIGNNAYSWILRHKKNLDEGLLSEYQTKKIQSLNLDRFFENWKERFEKVSKWVQETGKIPTKNAHSEFNSWLYSQRSRYKKGTLNEEQIGKLKEIKFDLEGLGKEKNEQKWLDQFQLYKEFLNKNGRDPGYRTDNEEEKSLYVWVMAQRAVMAGSAKNRKRLSKKRIDLLHSINFKWVGEGRGGEEVWAEKFDEFSKHVNNGILNLPTSINGERNPLYTWWMNQKISFKKNSLPDDKIQLFTRLGLSLEMDEKQVERSWDENFEELKNYIDSSGVLRIPHKIEGTLNPMYSWFRNQKTAYRKGTIPEERIEKFESIGILFDDSTSESRGFTKWSNKLREIAQFIENSGHYPKASTDNKDEARYYQSLARTRRALRNNELTEEQLNLMRELNIELE
ncbi:helicase associated domain-containing protein [Fulvivirga maritima]|uniref:helicase associated domain-containing protein n=1 Tax=Fulvivirga maritima TaxID=2904247 RepID=UPI001F22D4AA|nr:helicase associated domain-containing protein [Fulvivirga maritima]UII29058.1 helicase associated domain-containing protein [Fulvivirga maritima]